MENGQLKMKEGHNKQEDAVNCQLSTVNFN